MKTILKIEEAGMFMLASFAFVQLHQPWWIFIAFFLAPDLGMLGYLASAKTGAIAYNLLHHKGLAVIVWVGGHLTGFVFVETTGIILFAHASFDRIFGYGLKYPDSFQHTHLRRIGNRQTGDLK